MSPNFPFFTRSQQDKAQLYTIVESLADGVLVVNCDEVVLMTNHTLERLFPEAALWHGRQVLECLSQLKLYDAVRKTLKDREQRSVELSLTRAEGELTVLANLTPWLDQNVLQGVVLVFADVTELRRLERHRREFVANVSHELKTPLTVILGYAEMLLEDDELPDYVHDYMRKLEKNAQHLKNLVDDVLKLSQTDSGKFSLKPRYNDVGKMVQSIVERFEPWFEDKLIKVKVNIPQDLELLADPTSLEQVISNLLSNAIRYNNPNGTVEVSAASDGDWVSITVQDSGVGIPEGDLERVFERFYRVDKARTRDVGGTGLGLAIVKHLIELHGGKVTVASKVGSGSTFTAFFPVVEL